MPGRRPSDAASARHAGITYGYDSASNLTSYCDAGGTVTYAYDPANRLLGVATGSGSCASGDVVQPCTQYGYNNANELTSITYPTSTGVVDTIGYDHAGDETSTVVAKEVRTSRTSPTRSGSRRLTTTSPIRRKCVVRCNDELLLRRARPTDRCEH